MSKKIHRLISKNYNHKEISFSPLQQKILVDLNKKGYSMIHIDEIFGQDYYINYLKPIATNVKIELKKGLKIEGFEDRFKRGKDFVARFYDEGKPISFSDNINQIVVNDFFYNIAVKYLDTHPRITNIDYWLNIPKENTPRSSQKWHRDYEDLKLLKVFFYLGDVSYQSGPLSYIESTQFNGKYYEIFPRKFPNGVVVEDEEIDKYFSKTQQKTFILKDGTLVFADTSGLHKGGHCTEEERFLYTFTYTSFAGISPRNFKLMADKYFDKLEQRKKNSLNS